MTYHSAIWHKQIAYINVTVLFLKAKLDKITVSKILYSMSKTFLKGFAHFPKDQFYFSFRHV